MSQFDKRIAFVGGGNMAEAVLAGLIRKGTVSKDEILVTEKKPERREFLSNTYDVEVTAENSSAPRRSKTVFLAVKPQMVNDVKDELASDLTDEHIFISILAGTSREKLAKAFGHANSMIRVMPNLPSQVGCGVSAITFPDKMDQSSREWVRVILQSVGEVVEVPESLQDVVTAVSGSGPGYIFFLAQQLIAAAKEKGMEEDIAKRLVTEMLAGSAEVIRQSPDTPEELVRKVATPGGTTEAGLSALIEFDLAGIIQKTITRAVDRSIELNSS